MKKILCIALVLIASLSVSAQEKTIDKNEFDAILKSSFRGLGDKPHRVINTTEFSVEGRPEAKHSTKSTTEFLPGKFQSIFESQYIKKETIRIGHETYTREGNGEWRKEISAVKPKSENKLITVENQIEYKFLGTEKLDNQNLNVYAKIEKKKLINPTNNTETFSTAITKYWFGDGVWFWKSETNTENRTGETKSKSRHTTEYELDPNIKIEAPL